MSQYRALIHEFLWLLISLIGALVALGFILGWPPAGQNIDIHLHDTYFVFSQVSLVVPSFLFVTFLVFALKELRQSYLRRIPNIIIIVAGLLLIIYLLHLNTQLIRLGTTVTGWTAYSPLGGPAGSDFQRTEHPVITFFSKLILVIQLLVTLELMYVCYRWGMWRRIDSTKQPDN